jgi:hypothetical protein
MASMKRLHYPLWYRLGNKDRYLIWFNAVEDGDLDGVVLGTDSKVPIFVSLQALSDYAQAERIVLEQSEPILHNLDVVVRWLRIKRSKPEGPTAVDCNAFLAAWNLFADFSRSVGGNFDADKPRTQKIYDKLFWGNNLPSMTPTGKWYVPLWRRREKRIIREVMSQGLQMFRANTKLR